MDTPEYQPLESVGDIAQAKTDKLISQSDSKEKKNGGRRPGAGRPKGAKSQVTIDREAALRRFRDRVAANVDKLINAQMSLATGTQSLYVIHTDSKGQRRKAELVTDTHLITRFLEENEGEDGVMKIGDYAEDSKVEDYFFMTTAPPNNQALESLLNRTFGKAQDNIDLTSGGKKLDGAILGYVLPRPTDSEE